MPGGQMPGQDRCPGKTYARVEKCPGDICPPGHLPLMSEMVQKLCFNLKCMMKSVLNVPSVVYPGYDLSSKDSCCSSIFQKKQADLVEDDIEKHFLF